MAKFKGRSVRLNKPTRIRKGQTSYGRKKHNEEKQKETTNAIEATCFCKGRAPKAKTIEKEQFLQH